ncbi:MAG TPA: CAP domain-containing protein [Acidimicrobiia bacterium]|jgi:hypothetical protein
MIVNSRLARRRWTAAGAVVVMLTAFVGPLAASIVTATSAAAATPAGPFTVDMTNREDVRQFYFHVHDSSNGVDPGWTGSVAGCNPGTVSQDYLNATLTRINYFRAMAGVSSNVTLDATDNAKAQAAALMMSANGQLSHDPPNTWTCFSQDGHDGAASSNLALGNTGPDAIDQLMFDDTELGHRRNMLYEGTDVMGSGSVPANGTNPAAEAQYVLTPSVNPLPTPRDTFMAWPPKGFVPYQVVYPRWNFSLAGADFTNATVTMSQNGNNIPVTVDPTMSNFGDPAMIWVPTLPGVADGQAWPKPSGDQTYTVTVANVVVNGGAPQNFTYNTTVIDPSVGDAAHAPSGSATPTVGQASTYTVPAVPNATGYEFRTTPLTQSTFSDGAENGSSNWTLNNNGGGYDAVETTDVASGTHAFQLAQTTFTGPDTLTLNRTLVPSAASQLTFDSKVLNFDNLEASVQVSTDGGNSWSGNVYDQKDGNEGAFSHKTVSLAAYAGEQIKIRFAVGYQNNGGSVCECTNSAWHFDNVALANTQEAGTPVVANQSANPSFSFTPPAAGTYAIDVRPDYSNPTYSGVFSAALQVTASGGGGTTPTLGYVDSKGNAWAKQGVGGTWTRIDTGVSAISVASDPVHGPVIAVLTPNGVYAKQGSITAPWTRETLAGATAVSVATDSTNGPIIGVLEQPGFYVRQGLTGTWTKETFSGVTGISVATDPTHGPLLGYVQSSGVYAKVGITGAFTRETLAGPTAVSVATDSTNGPILGILQQPGFYVRQGLTGAWTKETFSGVTGISVASDPTHGPLLGYVQSSGVYAKVGITGAFTRETLGGPTAVAVATDSTNGPIIGINQQPGFYVRQGLTGAWTKETFSGTTVIAVGGVNS